MRVTSSRRWRQRVRGIALLIGCAVALRAGWIALTDSTGTGAGLSGTEPSHSGPGISAAPSQRKAKVSTVPPDTHPNKAKAHAEGLRPPKSRVAVRSPSPAHQPLVRCRRWQDYARPRNHTVNAPMMLPAAAAGSRGVCCVGWHSARPTTFELPRRAHNAPHIAEMETVQQNGRDAQLIPAWWRRCCTVGSSAPASSCLLGC